MNLEMRMRTVKKTEGTQTATLLTCTVEQQPSCGRMDGLAGEFGGGGVPRSEVSSLMFVLAMVKGLCSFHLFYY